TLKGNLKVTSTVITPFVRFILLIHAQEVIVNHINFNGYNKPYPYVFLIRLYPVNANKPRFLLATFFHGIVMDMFSYSGGVHAAACIVLAYFRPYIFKFSFGLSYEYQTVRLNDVLTPERFSFILIAVAIHHLMLFLLEIFRLNFLWDVMVRTLFSTLFSILICIILIYIFKPSRR